jgi:hypothetical protein
MTQKLTILLYGLHSVGLIIPCSSGVIYQNQTGGYSCLQDAVEGVFAPLYSEPLDHYEALYDFFYKGTKWAGNCANGIDEETADFIDATLVLRMLNQGVGAKAECLRRMPLPIFCHFLSLRRFCNT